jgi:CheY-like chemotaxis protein
MPIISIFSGVFCGKQPIIDDLVDSTGYRHVTDEDIVNRVEALTGAPESMIRRAFSSKTSVFNKFTHEKECAIAHLRFAVAEILAEEGLIIDGFSSLLIPNTIKHVLRVCLFATMPYRLEQALKNQFADAKEALKIIHQEDGDWSAWVNALYSKQDPWDKALYDIVLPMNRMHPSQASAIIKENLLKGALQKTKMSEKAQDDFLLASHIQTVLCKAGHDVTVEANDGKVLININKHVLMLSRLEDEMKTLAGNVSGVKSVQTKIGKDFYTTNIYHKHNFEVPSRVLLVDDEREFVQTLSERLQLRDMGSAFVNDGESALHLVKEDDPEVIIIDLKMPDIEGIEVLKKVKKQRPEIEVIVLTGHGSQSDRDLCMQLGAFDYLQKPVDINHLSEVLQKAHSKFRSKI